MQASFKGRIWFWKGPAPWYFVWVPDHVAGELESVAAAVTYGWGMIPVQARIGRTHWSTSMFPKDGSYLLPVKASVREAEGIAEGDEVEVELVVELPRGATSPGQ